MKFICLLLNHLPMSSLICLHVRRRGLRLPTCPAFQFVDVSSIFLGLDGKKQSYMTQRSSTGRSRRDFFNLLYWLEPARLTSGILGGIAVFSSKNASSSVAVSRNSNVWKWLLDVVSFADALLHAMVFLLESRSSNLSTKLWEGSGVVCLWTRGDLECSSRSPNFSKLVPHFKHRYSFFNFRLSRTTVVQPSEKEDVIV